MIYNITNVLYIPAYNAQYIVILSVVSWLFFSISLYTHLL